MTPAAAAYGELPAPTQPPEIPGWKPTALVSRYRFQGDLPVYRWRAEPTAPPVDAVAAVDQYLIDSVPVTQAVLHDKSYALWRETALWRQMYPQDGYAQVVAVVGGATPAVVQRLGLQWRPVLLPAQGSQNREVDRAIGRSLPERLAVPLLRRVVELTVFLLGKSRGIGPAPQFADFLDGLYCLPDLTVPQVKWVSPYVALPSAPDASGRKPAGLLLAQIALLVLTGRCDAGVLHEPLTTLRPGLTTQLPQWIAQMRDYDGAAAPDRLLALFDQAIGQKGADVVGDLYRPLGS